MIPRHNTQRDLEDWDELRKRALLEPDLAAYNPEEGDVDSRAPQAAALDVGETGPGAAHLAGGEPEELAKAAGDGPRTEALSQAGVHPATVEPGPAPVKDDYEPPAPPPARTLDTLGRRSNRDNAPDQTGGIIKLLGNAFAGAYGAANGGTQAVTSAVNRAADRNAGIAGEMAQERNQFTRNRNWREAKQAQNDTAARKEARLQEGVDYERKKAERKEAEGKVTTKEQAAAYQGALANAYPEEWNKLSPEVQRSMGPDDAAATNLLLDPARRREAETLHQKRRGESLEDYEKQRQLDKKYRRPPSVFFGGPNFAPGTEEDVDLDAVLAEQFGGADKIPPALKEQARLANSIKNPKLRYQAKDKILTSAMGEGHKEKTDDNRAASAEFKEQKAYADAIDDVRDIDQSIAAFETQAGIDLNDPNAEKQDIPGVGPIESNIPNWMYSASSAVGGPGDKALSNRAALREVIQNKVLAMSGKAATDAERREYREIYGLVSGGGEAQMVQALRRLKVINARRQQDASRNYPNAAAAFNQQASNTPSTETAPPAPAPAQPTVGPPGGAAPAPAAQRSLVTVTTPEGGTRQVYNDKVQSYLSKFPGTKVVQ